MSPVRQVLSDLTARTRRLLQVCYSKYGPCMLRRMIVFHRIAPKSVPTAFGNKARLFMFDVKCRQHLLRNRDIEQPFGYNERKCGHQATAESNSCSWDAAVLGISASLAGMPAFIRRETSLIEAPTKTSEPSSAGCTINSSSAAIPGSIRSSSL